MNAVVIVVVSVVVVGVVAAVLLLRSVGASPKQHYRRNLRSIRRIRKDIRAGDPDATSIEPTPGTFSAGS